MTPEQYRRALARLDVAYATGTLTWTLFLRLIGHLVAEHGETAAAAIQARRQPNRLN